MARLKHAWCGFTEIEGNHVVVNPRQVQFIRKQLDGTEIVFGEGHSITVTADLTSVQESLFEIEYDRDGNVIP